jgi:MoaA/NifB/PqqE/SkfB family radical SAM enzyme
MKNINVEKQNIVLGSSHLSNKKKLKVFDRIEVMIDNMSKNKAYKLHLEKLNSKDLDGKILEEFKTRYKNYRQDWLKSPEKQYQKNKTFISEKTEIPNPLCVDIEIAAICDLACPHCFREAIMTPDKTISEKLFKKIIDSIAKLEVPSIKLNWRGEPLLHPKIIDFINYAKKNKILEIMINTNCTNLDTKMSEKLIDSGIDQIIFSFDGGTKETYNKMRPGRFKKNEFENVYNNIKNFSQIRKAKGSIFPTTKIQMVLTKETRNEVENFHKLFDEYVDDVTVIQYNERGGNLDEIDKKNKDKIQNYLEDKNLDKNTPFMVTVDDKLYISEGRVPCPQLFQRLMVTYDGKVGMCCHDWGAQHCVGFLDEKAFNEDNELAKLEKSILENKKGFELLKKTRMPNKFNIPDKKISDLEKIWNGEELSRIRTCHSQNKVSGLDVCLKCTFKDTYDWREI